MVDGFRDPKQLLNLLMKYEAPKHALEDHDLGKGSRDPALWDAVLARARVASQVSEA